MNLTSLRITILVVLAYAISDVAIADGGLRQNSNQEEDRKLQKQCVISHLNLWNAVTDSLGKERWYTYNQGRAAARPVCQKKHSIEAVLGNCNTVGHMKFYARNIETGRTITRDSGSSPYVMFGKKGNLNILPGEWPQPGTYDLTITPGDNGKKMSLLVKVNGDC